MEISVEDEVEVDGSVAVDGETQARETERSDRQQVDQGM